MLGRKEDGDVVFIDYSQTLDHACSNADDGLGCHRGLLVCRYVLSARCAGVKERMSSMRWLVEV